MDAFVTGRDVALLAGVIFLIVIVIGGALYGARKFRFVFSSLSSLEVAVASLRKEVAFIGTEASGTGGQPSSLFRQLEALIALYVDLGLNRSLPSTRGWAASPDFLRALAAHVLRTRPQIVVECGSGVSTVVLALALNGSGHLYSLEHLSQYAEETRAELARHGVAERATVLEAPLRECVLPSGTWGWYTADGLPKERFDMLVVDGPPGSTGPLARYPAGPLLFGRLAEHGVIFVDDVGRADERAAVDRWLAEDPTLVLDVVSCEKGCVVVRRSA
jgi:predicted O-methyltransferase YrrM